MITLNVSSTPQRFQVVMCILKLKKTDVFSVETQIIDPLRLILILNVETEQIILKIVKDIQELMINVWNVLQNIFSISITKDARLKLRTVILIIPPSVFCNAQTVLIPIT
jgi:hypothetical protein